MSQANRNSFRSFYITRTEAKSKPAVDYVFRVQGTYGHLAVSGASMAVFKQPFYELVRDCRALAKTVDTMRHTIEYHSEYINLLISEAGEDEFEQLELQFAGDAQDVAPAEIVNYVAAIQRWVPTWHVNASDVAEMLRLDIDHVEAAVDNCEHYASKEPQWLKMESGSIL